MEPRLYIVMRRDLWDMTPGKSMAQAAHAQAEFDSYINNNCNENVDLDDCLCEMIVKWREYRTFGTTLVLHETLDTFSKISMNVSHWGYVTDPTYPYRNYYGEVFTRSEVTCMWAFVYTEAELEYMRQFGLHK